MQGLSFPAALHLAIASVQVVALAIEGKANITITTVIKRIPIVLRIFLTIHATKETTWSWSVLSNQSPGIARIGSP
jgi:hypothetical protein